MFDGKMMGERLPSRDGRKRTGPDDGRHDQRGGRVMDVMPKWAEVVLIPLISLLLGGDPFWRW